MRKLITTNNTKVSHKAYKKHQNQKGAGKFVSKNNLQNSKHLDKPIPLHNLVTEIAVEPEIEQQIETNLAEKILVVETKIDPQINSQTNAQTSLEVVKEMAGDFEEGVDKLGQKSMEALENKSFWKHLNDFKNTFFMLLGSWLVGASVAFYYRDPILKLITWPLGENYQLHFLYPAEGFGYLLKIYAVAGLLFAFPVMLVIVWFYIKGALETSERKFILFYILSAVLMATFGVVYGFYSLLPTSLQLLLNIQPENTEVILSASEYINFIVALLLVLVIVFQTPILVFSLIKTNLVKTSFFRSKRKEIYVGITVVSAVVTPTPDVLTMVLLMIPIIIFFEMAVFIGSMGQKKEVVLE